MKCPDCHTENKERAAFCERCGRALWPPPRELGDQKAAPVTHHPVKPEDVWDEPLPDIRVKQQPAEQKAPQEQGSDAAVEAEVLLDLARVRAQEEQFRAGRRRAWGIGLGLIAFLAVVFGTIYMDVLRSPPKRPAAPSTGATTGLGTGQSPGEAAIFSLRLGGAPDEFGEPSEITTDFTTQSDAPWCYIEYQLAGQSEQVPLLARWSRGDVEVGEVTAALLDPKQTKANFELKWPSEKMEEGIWRLELVLGGQALASKTISIAPPQE